MAGFLLEKLNIVSIPCLVDNCSCYMHFEKNFFFKIKEYSLTTEHRMVDVHCSFIPIYLYIYIYIYTYSILAL